jgi:hypothetical protein
LDGAGAVHRGAGRAAAGAGTGTESDAVLDGRANDPGQDGRGLAEAAGLHFAEDAVKHERVVVEVELEAAPEALKGGSHRPGSFGEEHAAVETFGNVLAATAFPYWLAAKNLLPDELATHDPAYEMTIGIRAVKPR